MSSEPCQIADFQKSPTNFVFRPFSGINCSYLNFIWFNMWSDTSKFDIIDNVIWAMSDCRFSEKPYIYTNFVFRPFSGIYIYKLLIFKLYLIQTPLHWPLNLICDMIEPCYIFQKSQVQISLFDLCEVYIYC